MAKRLAYLALRPYRSWAFGDLDKAAEETGTDILVLLAGHGQLNQPQSNVKGTFKAVSGLCIGVDLEPRWLELLQSYPMCISSAMRTNPNRVCMRYGPGVGGWVHTRFSILHDSAKRVSIQPFVFSVYPVRTLFRRPSVSALLRCHTNVIPRIAFLQLGLRVRSAMHVPGFVSPSFYENDIHGRLK